ncbi:acyl-CoA dehydrogenase [Roseovarius pelagicus]|uniref:Acyl-coenzyme A dehydrogenase n=1 Tax=Roseovarius pelagicus TaxID=2980108 RepID=A0ABY6DFY5_9RHOB|nr:acyl-CoA dehydrogenase [Roseovarius pelagicus]UXX84759.1 acyl-CoA dehydrogenase [Roseovarius pelagicus]
MTMLDFRRERLTKPIHRWARAALPSLSETEAEALKSGEVWWEAELFSGNPDWQKLRDVAPPKLTDEEQAFLDGPCHTLCEMVDDWSANRLTADLTDEAWQYLRENGFFGMIIPKEHGGLGFSALAHSEIVRFISTRSLVAAVTVMVPNSLGPGELLHQFGTDAQKKYWLPRLADGRELPAFGLTSEEAGSDAAAMVDTGIVCHGEWKGEKVLGLRLNWAKRYITLSPVCTVLGLAFKMHDPDGLLGGAKDIGITCALVPADLEGVEIGRRHIPAGQMFQNGPTTGSDVFIPLDHIIGGPDYAGRGWMMLMSALAAGRGISLPSLSAAATALSAYTTGAYARIRQQFGIPIAKFGGVQEGLGRLASGAYALDAARQLTCVGLDEGRALAVISGIMKSNATYRMRDALNDAMDIHSGKAVIDGPTNYLSPLYKAVPIGITVEGANILTRSLIIFGQGSIRAHPHLLDEMQALEEDDEDKSLKAFDRHFWAHVGHATRTLFRAFGRAWTHALFAPAPKDAGKVARIYRKMSRWAAAFALTADFAFLTMGGGLKRREMISARLGDVLSELYILSATVKRWENEGRHDEDLPLVQFAADSAFDKIGRSLDAVLANMPARWAGWFLRAVTLPKWASRGPSDELTATCANLITEPTGTRDRIHGNMFDGCTRDGIDTLRSAYQAVIDAAPIEKRLRDASLSQADGLKIGKITQAESDQLDAMRTLVQAVIAVDDFTPEELSALFPEAGGTQHSPELKSSTRKPATRKPADSDRRRQEAAE